MPRLALLVLGVVGLARLDGIPGSRSLSAQEADAELPRRQRDVGLILEDIVRRMERLAGNLEPVKPEEARKLRQAAERIRTAGMDRLLEEITGLLSSSNFVVAIGRQDRALQELDQIIALLEETRFRDAGSDDVRLNEEALRDVSELAGRQEQLLEATRTFLASKKAAEKLGELARELASLKEQQDGLNEGRSADQVDPEGARNDARAMDNALRSVEDLLRRQGDVLERFQGLPKDPSGLARTAELARRLSDLAEEAAARPEDSGSSDSGTPEKGTEKGTEKSGGKSSSERAERLKEAIGKVADELAREDRPVAGGKESRASAQKAVDAAREAAGGGEGSPDPDGQKVAEALREAQRALEKGAREAEDENTRRTAPLVQDEGLLEESTTEEAKRLEDAAPRATSETSRSALKQSGAALRRAAEAMQRFAKELSEGRSNEAGEAGSRAEDELQSAKQALEEGRDRHAGRSPGEKAGDLQRKLAEKTEEAEKIVDELQKKLGRKDAERDRELDRMREALAGASRSMRAAADAHQEGRQPQAQERGQSAAEQLELARKLARENQEKEPDAGELRPRKQEQDELARLTRKTSQKLATGTRAGQRQAEDVGSAAENMDQAGEELGQDDAEQAEAEQEKALSKLRNAQKALDRESEELARLNRERQVTSVLQQLTEIRRDEESVFTETVKIQAERTPDEGRRQRLLLRREADRLVTTQTGIVEKVDGLREQLKEELSRVFAFVLENVSADMREIVESIGDLEFGDYTQFLEREVLNELDQLIGAMKDELANLQKQQSQGSMPPMPPSERRLVPIVAELRMLTEMQGDVNRKTRGLQDLRDASDGKASEGWDRSLERLLQKQGSVSRLTGKLVEDFQKLSEGGAEGGSEGGGEEAEEGPENQDAS